MSNVKVISSIMGSGKTSFIMQMMRENPSAKYLYITPYIDEVNRVIQACPENDFAQPEATDGNAKSTDLLRLVQGGYSIASTHELFKRITDDTMQALKDQAYTLIIDEVLEVIQPLELKGEDVKTLLTKGALKFTEEDSEKTVRKLVPGPEEALDIFDLNRGHERYTVAGLREWARANRLVAIGDQILLWLFPPEIFRVFKEIWNLTYLFEGSYAQAYYQIHGLAGHELHSVSRVGDRYELLPYDPALEMDIKRKVRELVTVYDGPLNKVSISYNDLSKSWWNHSQNKGQRQKTMRAKLYNFYRNVCKAKSSEIMWTSFKANKEALRGGRFGKDCWLACNTRAVNSHRHKQFLAYVVNRFAKPEVVTYLSSFGFKLDEEAFALAEMLQWIWRSRIREAQSITIYVPSHRMRSLLLTWLSCFPEPLTTIEPV